jgi:uncharacterized membrane protein
MKFWLFFHILGIITWSSSALFLSGLLIFHVQEDAETVQPRLSALELRIFNIFAMPSMLLSLGTGWGMISGAAQHDMQFRWMWAKLGLAMLFFMLTMLLFKRIQDLTIEPQVRSKGRHVALFGMIALTVAAILYCVLIARKG